MNSRLAQLIELASRIEATSPKIGNVHPGAEFPDLSYQDFLDSAAAASGPLSEAATIGVGSAILSAIKATRTSLSTNTNLGIALLIGPLAAVPPDKTIADGIDSILASLSVVDAVNAYEAIRLAEPGGMGDVEQADVRDVPVITLLEAMQLAAPRDLIALEYSHGFAITLHQTVPWLLEAFAVTGDILSASVQLQLRLLTHAPDSLIIRRHGHDIAAEVQHRSSLIEPAGWPDNPTTAAQVAELDQWMRKHSPRLNPGTTADLICAGLFVALRDHTELTEIRNGPQR